MNKKVVLLICIAVFLIVSLNAYAETCTEIVKDCRYNDEQSCKMAIAPCIWGNKDYMYGADSCTPVFTCQSYAQQLGDCGGMSFCAYGGNGYSCWSCSGSTEACESQECLPRTPAPYCLPGAKRCAWSQDLGPSRNMITCTGQNPPYSWQFMQDCPYGVCFTAGVNNPQCFECDQDKDNYWRQDNAPDGLNYCKVPYASGDCADTAAECTNAVALPSAQDWCKANTEKINPGAKEICNNYVDDDCDTKIDVDDSDCKCSVPYTTGLWENACQDLDDFYNLNPSDLQGELGIKCSVYKQGNSLSDTCYNGQMYDTNKEKYADKNRFNIKEGDCKSNAPVLSLRECPANSACFDGKCAEMMKINNWTANYDPNKATIIFMPGQWSWYQAFSEFYNAYKDDYNLLFFQSPDDVVDSKVAPQLNNEIKKLIQERKLKYPVYFITHSRGYNRLRASVLTATDADVVNFYKNSIIFAVSPVPGGSAYASKDIYWFLIRITGSGVFGGQKWVDVVKDLSFKQQHQEELYGDATYLKFGSSVYDYYTFSVRGDAHLTGVWNYMRNKNKVSDWVKTWYKHYLNGVGMDKAHRFEYFVSSDYDFSGYEGIFIGRDADVADIASARQSEKLVFGTMTVDKEWKEFDLTGKSPGGVEHALLLFYKPVINKIKSIIDSSAKPLSISGAAILDESAENNVSLQPCDVEKMRLDSCIQKSECNSICNATETVSECISLCIDESESCQEVFKDELDYCLSLQAQPTNITEGKGEGQVTPIVPITEECQESWTCTAWLPAVCPENETQTRACKDLNKCGTEKRKPVTKRTCVYTPEAQLNITVQIPKPAGEAEQPQPVSWGIILAVFAGILLIILGYFAVRKARRK